MKRLAAPIRVDRPLSPASLNGHLETIEGSVWGWWILGPVQWDFQPVETQEDTLSRIAAGLALVAGHDIHLRRTEIPFNAHIWAEELDWATPDPLPDVEGCEETWASALRRSQDDLAGFTMRVCALGVCLGMLPRRHKGDELPADLAAVDHKLSERFAGAGFQARPAHARELAWLTHRSIGVGVPSPVLPAQDFWDKDACRPFGDLVRWESSPLGQTTKIVAGRDGTIVERYVAVLTMGRMEDQRFPENGRPPWLAFVEQLRDPETKAPIPVEVSAVGSIMSGRDGTDMASRWLMRAQNIYKHYREHDEEPPPSVQRTIEHATDVYDEVSEGPTDLAARFEGVFRFAVDGPTEAKALEYARLLQTAFAEEMKMWPELPGGVGEPLVQPRMLREFRPGAGFHVERSVRRMPVRMFAAGIPNAGDIVGTPTGHHLGETTGAAPRPVLHDGHYPMRHNRPEDPNNNSGFMGLVSNLGGGKSTLLATIAEQRARDGIPTWVLDPSPGAPLAKLCDLPYLAPFSTHIALSGAQAGLLNPYRMIPDPARLPAWDDGTYRAELAGAAGDRKELVVDTLMSLLADSTRKRDGIEDAVRESVAEAGGTFGTNPLLVLDHLEVALPAVARSLREMATGIARLIFPPVAKLDLVKEVPRGAVLTVISTGDLAVPDPDSDREDWSGRERAAYTALGLAAFLTTRGVYAGRMSDPKTVLLDECRVLRDWRSGRMMVKKLGFDGRKYTAEVIAACQDPDHLTSLGVAPFLGGVWLGRQLDLDVARRCFAMGGTDTDPRVLLELAAGEFVYRDTFGRVATMQVKRPHPALFAATNTESVDPRDRLRVAS